MSTRSPGAAAEVTRHSGPLPPSSGDLIAMRNYLQIIGQ